MNFKFAFHFTNISDNIFGNHNYQYDYRGFLKDADGVEYSYDKNGNLRFVGSKELKYENQIKDQEKNKAMKVFLQVAKQQMNMRILKII